MHPGITTCEGMYNTFLAHTIHLFAGMWLYPNGEKLTNLVFPVGAFPYSFFFIIFCRNAAFNSFRIIAYIDFFFSSISRTLMMVESGDFFNHLQIFWVAKCNVVAVRNIIAFSELERGYNTFVPIMSTARCRA